MKGLRIIMDISKIWNRTIYAKRRVRNRGDFFLHAVIQDFRSALLLDYGSINNIPLTLKSAKCFESLRYAQMHLAKEERSWTYVNLVHDLRSLRQR